MKLLNYWKTILIASIIFYGSITSSSNLNRVPIFEFKNIDKLIHFAFYFLLSISLQSSFLRNTLISKKKLIVITLLIVISYGLLMEVIQFYFTTNRCAELFDALANSFGCICGIIIFPFLIKLDLVKYL